MEIRSHFDLGEKAWLIRLTFEPKWEECPSCEEGTVPTKDGRGLPCPRCDKKGLITDRSVHRWVPASSALTVGQIRLQVGSNNRDGSKRDDDEESYMMWETGVGSGSVYYVRDLYRSLELAQAECDKRNAVDIAFACVRCRPEFERIQYSLKGHDWRYCPVHTRANHVPLDAAEKMHAEIEARNAVLAEEV